MAELLHSKHSKYTRERDHAMWPRTSILGPTMDLDSAIETNLFLLLSTCIASAIAWHTRHGGGWLSGACCPNRQWGSLYSQMRTTPLRLLCVPLWMRSLSSGFRLFGQSVLLSLASPCAIMVENRHAAIQMQSRGKWTERHARSTRARLPARLNQGLAMMSRRESRSRCCS